MANSPLVYRHNRVTRLTHWIDAVALALLFMSGLMIFNAHPNLYWGSKSDPGTAFFSIGSAGQGSAARGVVRLYGYGVDTTGVLGLQRTADGNSERAFPSWITVPGYYSLAAGRRWHFFFGWVFALNGLLYVIYNLATGHLRKFFFTPADAVQVPAMIAHYLRLRKDSPQTGEYNPLQKLAYTSVLVILTPLVLLSGMAMSPQLNVSFNWLPASFGGRQSARTIHFVLAFSFLLFTFGHVFMVITQGFFNNMRSMLTGWYREKLAHAVESTAQAPRVVAPESDPEASPQEQSAAHSSVMPLDSSPDDKPAPSVKVVDATDSSPAAPPKSRNADERKEDKQDG
jgi:Ni/Fe-hydrogenase b-type cytochrome subunit